VSKPTQIAHGRVAALARHRGADDPDLQAAQVDLRTARLVDLIKKEAEADPPLSEEVRAKLAVILLGGHNAA
jgi:hypothetical protein